MPDSRAAEYVAQSGGKTPTSTEAAIALDMEFSVCGAIIVCTGAEE
jgi:hypothetical protein